MSDAKSQTFFGKLNKTLLAAEMRTLKLGQQVTGQATALVNAAADKLTGADRKAKRKVAKVKPKAKKVATKAKKIATKTKTKVAKKIAKAATKVKTKVKKAAKKK